MYQVCLNQSNQANQASCHPWAELLDISLNLLRQTQPQQIWNIAQEAAIVLGKTDTMLLFELKQQQEMCCVNAPHLSCTSEGTPPSFPLLLIQQIQQKKTAIITELPCHDQWTQDLYWLTHSPQAIACLPILQGETLYGAFYLEYEHIAQMQENLSYLETLCKHTAAALHNAHQHQYYETQLRFLTQFYAFAENSADGIYLIMNDRVEYLNPAMAKLLDRSRESLLHQQPHFYFDCIHPEDLDSFIYALLSPIPQTNPIELQYRILRPDGEIRDLRDVLKVIFTADGDILGFQGILSDITELTQAEAAVRQGTHTLHQLTNAIPGIVYQYQLAPDGTENVPYINQQVNNFLGYTPEQIMANPQLMWNSILPEDLVNIETVVRNSATELAPFSVEFRAKVHGEERWYSSHSVLELQPDHSIIWSGVILDVSKRKVAEADRLQALQELKQLNTQLECRVTERTLELEQTINQLHQEIQERCQIQLKLQESQEFNQRIIESSPNTLYTYDFKENKVLYLSNQISSVTGLSTDVINEQGINLLPDYIHPDDFPNVAEHLAAIQSTADGQVLEVEYRARDEQEGWRWLLNRYTIFKRDSLGQVSQIVGMVQNIHDRKLIEEALRQSEARFRGCLESKAMGVFFLNRQGVIVDANDRFLEMVGYSRQQLSEGFLNWHILTPPEYWEVNQPFIESKGNILPREKEYFHQNGTRIPVIVSAAVLEDLDQIVQIVIDISDRKKVEAQLHSINDQLYHTNLELVRATRLRDEFLANMSHELRTPLNSILGLSEGLLEEVYGTLTERQKKSIATIERSGAHLLELINDLLELAKIESGKLELHPANISIRSICELSVNVLRPLALQKRVVLETQIEDALDTVYADELRLRQILINLLSNAVKFTPEGGSVSLEVFGNTTEQRLYFKVRDTGIGIAPNHMSKLFQTFVQIDSNLNRKYMGTGLGLALVKRLTELHEGEVFVESKINEGSCFTVKIPWQSENSILQNVNESPVEPKPPAKTIDIPQVTILLAEDNEDNIDTFSTYLTTFGYKVICARNGQEAVSMTKEYRPNLILMDIQMPIMDGLEAMRHIRLQPEMKETPILTLTALAMPGDRERCFAAGANEYLSKPIRLKQLAETIQHWLTTTIAE